MSSSLRNISEGLKRIEKQVERLEFSSRMVNKVDDIFPGCRLEMRAEEQLGKDRVDPLALAPGSTWVYKSFLYKEDFKEGSESRNAIENLERKVGSKVYVDISEGTWPVVHVEKNESLKFNL